jgi:hypothetical protein
LADVFDALQLNGAVSSLPNFGFRHTFKSKDDAALYREIFRNDKPVPRGD